MVIVIKKLFEISQKRIEYQISSCDAIDQKIGTLIGFASVIVAIALGFEKDLAILEKNLFRLGSLFMALSTVVMYFGYRKVVLDLGMSVDEIVKLIKAKPSEKIFLYTQTVYNNEAFKQNKKILEFKNQCLGWGAIILLIGVGIFISSLFI